MYAFAPRTPSFRGAKRDTPASIYVKSHLQSLIQQAASAMLRQGLQELRGVLYPESNVAQPPEYGLYGTRTPGEVAEARKNAVEPTRDEEPKSSPLASSLRRAESRSAESPSVEPSGPPLELD